MKKKVKSTKKQSSKIECKCADIEPYHHIEKYIKDMKSNKGKRIELIVTGSGSEAHIICKDWKHTLITVAQLFSLKEPTI
tara:strand:- start:281 stop:520 length:240 start_codon:yes stop_codon:yes gene_type:complete